MTTRTIVEKPYYVFDTAFAPGLEPVIERQRSRLFGHHNIGNPDYSNMQVPGMFPSDMSFDIWDVVVTLWAESDDIEEDKKFLDAFQAGAKLIVEIGEVKAIVMPLVPVRRHYPRASNIPSEELSMTDEIEPVRCRVFEKHMLGFFPRVPTRQCFYAFIDYSPELMSRMESYKGKKQLKVFLSGQSQRDADPDWMPG